MAVKPKTAKLNATSDEITAAVMNEMAATNPSLTTLRPDGSVERMHIIGEYITGDLNLSNAFIHTLINMVVKVVYTQIYFENPWKRLKKGYLEAGDMVEEIAFNLCEIHDYDSTTDYEFPAQQQEFIYTTIHKLNYEKYYKRTINRMKLLQAFQTKEGMESLVNELLNMMYVSAEFDEFVSMKYMLGRYYLNGWITPQAIPTVSTENMKDIASIIKGVSNNMTLLNELYTRYGVPTSTEKRNQIVLINTTFDAQFDVEVLAYAFNMDKADIYGQRIFIDPWTPQQCARMDKIFKRETNYVPFTATEIATLNQVPVFVLDERFFMVYDYLMEMTDFFNPEKLYWNYWLHTWRVMSVSPYVNAVAFTSNIGTITGVTVNPSTLTIQRGSWKLLEATVEGKNGIVPQNVQWELTGSNGGSFIMSNGMLTVTEKETSASLTVTATAYDRDGMPFSGSCSVTIPGQLSVSGNIQETTNSPS